MSCEDAVEELRKHVDTLIKYLVNDIGLIKLLGKLNIPVKEKYK